MLSEILQDAETPVAPDDSAIKRISFLAATQLKFQRLIAQAQEDLADLELKMKEISERLLPDAMLEAGVNAFELSDGSKISVKPFYGASITEENQKPCFSWLEENGHAALIKKEVTATPARDDLRSYIELCSFLDKSGLGYRVKESVHQGTLSAFVREQIESGADLPMDLFRVFTGRKAKITEAK